MAKVLVLYHSIHGHVEAMAQAVAEAYHAQREALGFPGLKQRAANTEAAA